MTQKVNNKIVKKTKTKSKPKAKPSEIKKWSRIAKEELMQDLIRLKLVEKKSHHTLLKLLQEPPYSFSQRQAYQYITKTNEEIANTYKEWNINALELVLADLQQQKETAKNNNDRKLILEITKEENKLKGLYIEKHEVKQEIEMRFDFGVEKPKELNEGSEI